MKSLFTALSALPVLLALSGCPQSRTPDIPPHAPQPKAVMHHGEALQSQLAMALSTAREV